MSDVASRLARLSPEKQALLAQKMRGGGPEAAVAEPIAIVGIGCRFPGGVDSPAGFWRLLSEGRDVVAEVPADRWSAEAYFDPDPTRPGYMNTRWGSWLSDVDAFDALFFGLAPRETAKMDPQQRLVLEVCWEALEDAGQTMEGLAGSRTGVFVGTHVNDYAWMTFGANAVLDAYDSTGTAHSIVANRVSYLLDLRGPSLAVDTACSSSLVAVHLAVQALRQRECDLALACGVNLMLSPLWGLALSKLGMLSADGRCRTFDARANGIVRGEGSGAVALKRLSEALAAGDRIWAVVRGTATNSDGRTNGLTAPNGLSQQAVLRAAIANAGIAPEAVGAIEAHGTGTPLGDPIEVEALAEVLGKGDATVNPCVLGSVKTNIGHLEGAAGMAGLIKLVLSLHHEGHPRLVHFEKPNPLLALEGTRFVLPTAMVPWTRGTTRRIGGVSAFGFGGTNAHVVVEEAPKEAPRDEPAGSSPAHVLVVSARSPEALRARAESLCGWLGAEGAREPLDDICHTAWARRSRYEHGLAVVGGSLAELGSRLRAAAQGVNAPGIARVQRGGGQRPGLVFAFTGQGAQWPGMGLRLSASEPVAQEAFEACEAAIQKHAGWSLREELARPKDASRLGSTEIAQPAIFAVQVAVAAWWRSLGVVPDAVVGHSMGEVAAAHVAGILSLEEAARVIVHRSRLMEPTRGQGRMLAVELPYERSAALARDLGASVAAVNSPTSCVLSGPAAALEEAVARIERERGVSRWLPVEYAFHSAQMEPARAELARVLGTVERHSAVIPVASTVTGTLAAGSDYDGPYWARNIREPVRFREAVDTLGGSGHRTFVEIGPHPALVRPIQQCAASWEGGAVSVHPSLHRDMDEPQALRAAAGALHLSGHPVDARPLFPAGGRVVRFPAYPWQRERYPVPRAARVGVARPALAGADQDPLIGARLATALETYELHVTPLSPAWLGGHRILGQVLYPAAALLSSAWAAGVKTFRTTSVQVEGLAIGRALTVPDEGGSRVQIASTDEAGVRRVRIFSQAADEGGPWLEHASACLAPLAPIPDHLAPAEAPEPLREAAELYGRLAELGAEFGPQFRLIHRFQGGDGRAVADISVSPADTLPDGAAFRHPPLLDACLQVATAALLEDQSRGGFLLLPVAIERAWCRPFAGTTLRVEALARDRTRLATEGVLFDLQGRDEGGALVLALEGLHMRPSRAVEVAPQVGLLCALEWVIADRPAPRPSVGGAGRFLLLADQQGTGDAVASRLAASGIGSICLTAPGDARAAAEAGFGLPADPAARRAFLDEVLAKEGPWRGVVHLGGLDAPAGADIETGALQAGSSELLGNALDVLQAMASREDSPPPRLWLVSRGACAAVPGDEANGLGASPLGGLARVAGLEHPSLRPVRVDLDPATHAVGADALVAELLADDDEMDVAFRDGARLVSRVRQVTAAFPPEPAPQLLRKSPGRLLEELAFVPLARRAPGPGEVEIRVRAAGLNFRDVLNALGLYPGPEIPLGNECVGEITAVGASVVDLALGDQVVAVAFASLADFVTTPASMVVRKPAHLSIAAAATLPITFLTAHYALHELGGLRTGDRVLIHAGAGGVGLAAVQLALRAGATVLATAGSDEKRSFLRRLGVSHTMDSRSLSFADEVRVATDGRGVDVVLNSLSGDFLKRSIDVTARGGRFLELGKRDIVSPEEMGRERPDLAYHVVYLGEVCDRDPTRVGEWLRQLVDDVAAGRLQTLPFRVFKRTEAVDAFRYMAQGRHVGKVVLQLAEALVVGEFGFVRPGTTHLVTGGLGGVGLALAEWLAARGAAAIVLLGRSSPTPAAETLLAALRARGTRVVVEPADVADGSRLTEVFARIDAELPPLGGVWHAAGVLDDAPLAQQSRDRFARVLAPKLAGAWNLHRLTSHRDLDAFVLFSSIASLVGWPGQGNYAAGNAFLDGLAHHRRQLGLPALSVNWGAFEGVGMAAGLGPALQERLERRGLRWMKPAAAFTALEEARGAARAQVGVASLDFAAFATAAVAPGLQRMLVQRPKAASRPTTPAPPAAPARDLASEVAATPAARRRALVTSRVREQALRTLGLAADFPLDPRQGLRDVGLDSLMAVELRNALQQLAARSLPSTLLFDFPTVEGLSGYLLDVVAKADPQPAATPPVVTAPPPTIADEDVEALLREELAKLRPGPR